jgi:rhodanese-related sulfurtransferase
VSETPLDRVLARAAARVARLAPREAYRAQAAGAVIVDMRSSDDRARTGVIPGSVHIPRTVLEWRLDPGGAWRTPHISVGDRLVLVCCDGCSSLLAAESLVELGLDAADVEGGVAAWEDAGLPLVAATPPQDGMRPGTGPPEPR